MANSNLNKARAKKNDEFYTQLKDIEEELQHYPDAFRGKVVYLNADNPEGSMFWKYFVDNFDELGLKKLIATYYSEEEAPDVHLYDKTGLKKKKLTGDGDFRSPEAIKYLKEADVIVSNPPFSLFREYIAQLIEYDKKFLIIGSQNAITYKDVFPLILQERLWLGVNYGGFSFDTPEGEVKKFGNIAWYTNLQELKREPLELTETYYEDIYPKYDNYDAINIDRVACIPKDYTGVMGVPIGFIVNFNKEQFELLGSNSGVNQDPKGIYGRGTYLGGKETYKRLFIQKK